MSQFSRICKAMEEMDPDTYVSIVSEKSTDIIRVLSDITEDGFSGLAIFIDFVLCAVAADGKLSELKEDIVLVCMMVCAVDGKISYKERKWINNLID